MLSKIVTIGDKIELVSVAKAIVGESSRPKSYFSTVHDVLSEDTLEIIMPMEKTKLILLPVDEEFQLIFCGETGIYQCTARVADRYKSNNVYLLMMELTSILTKLQRRDFYRQSCSLKAQIRSLEEEEVQAIEGKTPFVLQSELPLQPGIIVDISGGGIRFVAKERYEPESLVFCSYSMDFRAEHQKFEIIGKVLAVKEVENHSGSYEHRVQYYHLDEDIREAIIKSIFEAQRIERQKERTH